MCSSYESKWLLDLLITSFVKKILKLTYVLMLIT